MPAPSTFSEQVTALPAGAGGVQGLGETFGADPCTGTGSFRIPLSTPGGYRGQTPQLALVYSSGAGAGLCGAGWSFGVGSIRRRTDKGVPQYADDDVFLLGDDELVPTRGGYHVRRAEGAFARIRRCRLAHAEFWAVTDRTGVRRLYGRQRADRDGPDGKTGAWLLSEERDPCGNTILYTWTRDEGDQRSYLQRIDWGPFRVTFGYEDRPDVLRSGRLGYPEVTSVRLRQVDVQVRRTSDDAYTTFDRYVLGYTRSSTTGLSLLTTVTRTGTSATSETRTWPVLTLGYADPRFETQAVTLTGNPSGSLSGPDLALVDLDGNGLPDIVESTSYGMTVRRNQGDGRFSTATSIRSPSVRLRDEGVFLSDMRGAGGADLVTPTGFYANDGAGFGTFRPFDQRPSFDLEGRTTRFVDLDGDGVGDVVVQQGSDLLVFRNVWADRLAGGRSAAGFEAARRVAAPAGLPRVDDRWTRLADTTGDGLTDWVRLSRTGMEVFQHLGHGHFAEPRLLPFPEPLPPATEPDAISLSDLTGSGCADVVVRLGSQVWVFPNASGEKLLPKVVLLGRAVSRSGSFEPVDLFGTGTKGLLTTAPGQAWMFHALFGGVKPDLLHTVANGLGLTTTITYGTSTADLARDRAAARPWKFPLPFPVRVVHRLVAADAVSGRTTTTRYSYHHGYYDGTEREFRGFAVVDQHDADVFADVPSSSAPSRVRRFFDVGNGQLVREAYAPIPGVTPPDTRADHPLARRALRSKLVREETYGEDGGPDAHRPYLVTHTSYSVVRVMGPVEPPVFFAAPARVDTWHTERTGEHRHAVTTLTYDRYGRPTEVRERGDGREGTFATDHEDQQTVGLERSTKTTYATLDGPETDDYDGAWTCGWLLDAPLVVERWGGPVGSETLLARTRTFYDGTAYIGGATLTKGLVSQVQEWSHVTGDVAGTFPGAGAAAAKVDRGGYVQDGTDWYVPTARSQFDSRGMPTGSKDPRGGETAVTYDATHGLFPIEVVDPLDHPMTLTRGEFPHEIESIVDANGNRTEFTYDPCGLPASKAVMGKFVSGAWQGDPPTDPTEIYEYTFDSVPNRVVTRTRQVREGATLDVYRYADGSGKVLQERHTAEESGEFRVTGHQVFDHKGLVVRAYQPTIDDTSAYGTAPTDVPFLETTYDPLGRPVRVDHPDGTFETTTYHPWVKVVADRNDNAGHLTVADTRYGAFLTGLRSHLSTPTRTYVDALGRDIAVQEDNGAGTQATFRVTTYLLTTQYSGTTYDLTLDQELAANYFVFVRGAVDDTAPDHYNMGVRVTHDPWGTGDLSTSSGNAVIRLSRGSNAQGTWKGSITVVECLGDTGQSGFQLVDVKTFGFAATTSVGEQTATTTCTAWSDLSRVALYGAWYQGGTGTASGSLNIRGLCAGFEPSSTNTLTGSRWCAASIPSVNCTVFVVQWGAEHTLQRIVVSGTSGGDDLDSGGEWQTEGIATVASREAFVTATGWTKSSDNGPGFTGTVVTLGTGLSPAPDVTSTVAVGSEASSDKKVWVTVHRHPSFVVHRVRTPNASSTSATFDATVAPPGETNAQRLPLWSHSHGASNTAFARSTWWVSFTADTTLRAERITATGSFLGWATAVDLSRVVRPAASSNLHVTRTVLDLLDRPVEVWDARGLSDATWRFTYDRRGQRWKVEHTTGTGERYTLPDSAGNPIWSRDARAVEADRTFDASNRPLTESVGGDLRRKWTYVAYDAGDTASKAANLFGRVEEVRDQDGLRFFAYDWRGLPTTISHRFWEEGGSLYANVEDTISATARGSLSTWLALTDLPDTTTLVVDTVYDAAGRPTSESWPLVSRKWEYHPSGTLSAVTYDRGSGDETAVSDITYNARGQATGWSHGNGLTTEREYDPDTERLTRIFVKKASPQVRFQDLAYAYDPVGNPVLLVDQLAVSSYASNQVIPNSRRFGYDPRYRLILSTGKRHKDATDGVDAPVTASPSPTDYLPYTHRYSYDAVGNFTVNQEYSKSTIDYKSGLPDRFDGVGAESYDYDDNGCVTATPRHAAIGYQWDAQPTLFDLGGGGDVRVRRHGDQVVARFRSATNAIRIKLGAFEYEKTSGYRKVILHLDGPAGRCAQVEKVAAGTDASSLPVFHVHGDHLGSGQALTKADGTMLCQEEFFVYGRSSDRRDARNRYRFIGVERDEDTGLCMTGPRSYDPVSGRFLQGDPVVGGAAYVYSRGNPVRRMDPGGYADGVTPAVEPTSVSFPDSPLIDPAPPLLSTSQELNAPWSVDGVRAVLQTTPEGADLLSYLDEHRAEVQVFSSRLPVTETSFTVVDETGRLEGATLDAVQEYGGANTIQSPATDGFQHGQTDPATKNGADTGDVFLDERLSNFEAAVTLYHEVLHIKDPGGPSSISHDQMWQESDAFRAGLAGAVGADATPARTAQWDGMFTTATKPKLPADFMRQVRSNATRVSGWLP